MNIDKKVPISTMPFNSSNIIIPFAMDFTQRQYSWSYYTILDVISAIGGVNAAFAPILKKIAPVFMLYFLYCLASIIKDKYLKDYRDELTSFVKYALFQLTEMSRQSSNIA